MTTATGRAIDWSEKGLVPDSFIRAGIRRLLRERLDKLAPDDYEAQLQIEQSFIQMMNSSPLAVMPEKANEQHYEVPASFFEIVLGKQRKYSCAYWPEYIDGLDDAEAEALALTCKRAGIKEGMEILELGCGWGALTLWLAKHYPNTKIVAVSNSNSQKAYIEQQAETMWLSNIEVITADVNFLKIDRQFDRIVSIEMFEHMRNYRELYRRIYHWLKPGGLFFKHIFIHRTTPYAFEESGDDDWMTRYFFSGGIMPSDALPLYFQDHLKFIRRWCWDGRHYEKTCDAWLANMDSNREALMPILAGVYGDDSAQTWWMRWRMFFMACEELFQFGNGDEWFVSHYRFRKGTD